MAQSIDDIRKKIQSLKYHNLHLNKAVEFVNYNEIQLKKEIQDSYLLKMDDAFYEDGDINIIDNFIHACQSKLKGDGSRYGRCKEAMLYLISQSGIKDIPESFVKDLSRIVSDVDNYSYNEETNKLDSGYGK